MRRISKLLAAGRLVTLLGPGGSGKTRLAIEAAAQENGEVCFVDLAPVDAAGARHTVVQAVVEALGLRESGLFAQPAEARPDPEARLVAALSERPLLLILDNCEHVVDSAARLAHRLLGACPELRVLATSREALGITGEGLCPLPRSPCHRPRRTPSTRWNIRRSACSPTVPPPYARIWTRRPSSAPSSGSASRSTGSRWPSSWPPHACARSPWRRSPPAWTTGSGCSRAATVRRRPGTGRCVRWSSGAGTCWARTNGPWRGG